MGKVTKVVGAVCTATGMMVMSGLVASGAAVCSVAQGIKMAKKTVKRALREERRGNARGLYMEARCVSLRISEEKYSDEQFYLPYGSRRGHSVGHCEKIRR